MSYLFVVSAGKDIGKMLFKQRGSPELMVNKQCFGKHFFIRPSAAFALCSFPQLYVYALNGTALPHGIGTRFSLGYAAYHAVGLGYGSDMKPDILSI